MSFVEAVTLEPQAGTRIVCDSGGEPGSAPEWHLEGELDWTRYEALRVICGRLDGEVLLIASLRPAGGEGHDRDALAAARRGREGAIEHYDGVLLSLEYDEEDSLRRLGAELWAAGTPLRIAADRAGAPDVARAGGLTRARTALELRADGRTGSGAYELVTRA
jgi:hypothetical protein